MVPSPPGPRSSTNPPFSSHLSPTLHAPTTTYTQLCCHLKQFRLDVGTPFPRLFSSRTLTRLKFRTCEIHVPKVSFPYGHWPPKPAMRQGMQRWPWVCHSREAWRYTMTHVSERSDVVERRVNMVMTGDLSGSCMGDNEASYGRFAIRTRRPCHNLTKSGSVATRTYT